MNCQAVSRKRYYSCFGSFPTNNTCERSSLKEERAHMQVDHCQFLWGILYVHVRWLPGKRVFRVFLVEISLPQGARGAITEGTG